MVLLLLIALYRYREQHQIKWLHTAAIALAIGLNSSPLFYSGLLTFGLAYFLYTKVGVPLFENEAAELTAPQANTMIFPKNK